MFSRGIPKTQKHEKMEDGEAREHTHTHARSGEIIKEAVPKEASTLDACRLLMAARQSGP